MARRASSPGATCSRHADPADRGDARGDGAAPRSATTSSARTRRSRALEERVAGLLGHEAALFTPDRVDGQPARRAAARRARARSSSPTRSRTSLRAELGAAAVLSGISSRSLGRRARAARPGRPAGAHEHRRRALPGRHGARRRREHPQLRRRHGAAARGDPRGAGGDAGRPASRCTSTAPGCGTPTSPSGVPLADYGREFDTVSVCLSKGLGAPVGSRARRLGRGDGRGAHLAQALRRRHAPGRHPRRRRPARPRPPRRAARRRPRPRGPRSPRPWPRPPRPSVDPDDRRDQHRHARRRRGRLGTLPELRRSAARARGVRTYAAGPGGVRARLAPRRRRRRDRRRHRRRRPPCCAIERRPDAG